MSGVLLVHVIALVFLIVSGVFAVINPPNLSNPLLWAVWSIAVIVVLGGFVTG